MKPQTVAICTECLRGFGSLDVKESCPTCNGTVRLLTKRMPMSVFVLMAPEDREELRTAPWRHVFHPAVLVTQ